MSEQIPAIPPGTAADQLVAAVNDRLRRINLALAGGAVGGDAAAVLRYGTHAVRLGQPARSFASGSVWVETDRNNLAYQIQAGAWVYTGGVLRAAFAGAPANLGAGDSGLLWYVSDYAHVLRWMGTGWEFVDEMGGYIAGRVLAPDGSGWQLCDGTATHYLHVSGGVASEVAFTTPDIVGFASGAGLYAKLGSAYSGTRTAATLPTMGNANAGVTNATVTGAAALAQTAHQHVVTLPGDPVANLALLPYFRR